MESTEDLTKKIIDANVIYHSKLAETYDETQPHFKKENVKQVKSRLKKLSELTEGKSLLDIGCGTGFILELAYKYFDEVYGIDITPMMLEKAKEKISKNNLNNIQVKLANSENIPFKDCYFDVVTAYGFLHHLPSLKPTLKETFRILKKDGIFYSDQDPNYYFWESMKSIEKMDVPMALDIERRSVCQMESEVQRVVGKDLDSETIKMAEYLKSLGGFKEEDIKDFLNSIGFKSINYEYTWYWQEGKVINDLSEEVAVYFENHLRLALPITRNFFKYVRIEATK